MYVYEFIFFSPSGTSCKELKNVLLDIPVEDVTDIKEEIYKQNPDTKGFSFIYKLINKESYHLVNNSILEVV